MTPRDEERLAGVHPQLVEAVTDILAAMEAAGSPMFVVMGARTPEEEAALFAEGRTAPGHIVTNDDGTVKRSNHEPQADGLGHAVDCAFSIGDPFADSHPWLVYGEAAESRGLTWGGRWPGLVDRPHIELRTSNWTDATRTQTVSAGAVPKEPNQ